MDNKAYIKIKRTRGRITQVQGSVPFFEQKEGDYYVVRCPLFKTFGSSKKSLEEARKDHEKDLEVFLKIHLKRGTLIRAIKDLDWVRTTTEHYTSASIPEYLLNKADGNQSFKQAA